MNILRLLFYIIVGIVIIFYGLHFTGKYLIDNRGVEQMGIIDKIRFLYYYGLCYKGRRDYLEDKICSGGRWNFINKRSIESKTKMVK